MRSRTKWTRTARFTALVVACLSALNFETGAALGGERKYLVMLASAPKQFPMTGVPTGGYTNKEFIRRQYFEKNPNDTIGSFAEYWEEISYGDVTVSGRVTDWLLLPWAIQPPLIDPTRQTDAGPPIADDINDPALRLSPANFADLNDSGVMEYGHAESFNNANAAAIVDLTGDPNNQDDGPFVPGPGSGHTTPNAGKDVYKPGERFVDLDEDGRWDGFDENLNWMDHNGDGRPDNLGPWIDLNGDGEPNNAPGCIYLPDSDNDGNPDCCPNGPGNPGCRGIPLDEANACPPTHWTNPNGDEITDCNGDGESDEALIAEDPTLDDVPFVESGDQCVPGEGDGIVDQCQFTNYALPCRDPNLDCSGEDPGPCCNPAHPPCAPFDVPQVLIPRCEYDDANGDNALDLVEPFENFMRRWDPCLFDPDVKAPLNAQTARAHWIKVYDPNSLSAGTAISCDAPAYAADYGDPAYINNNYPGPADELANDTEVRVVYGPHDPLNKLTPAECICSDGSPCQDIVIPGSPPIPKACPAGLHAVFNPPDQFTNMITGTGAGTRYTTKFQATPGAGGQASFATATPEPGTSTVVPGETEWYRQSWRDRYGVADDQVPDWPQGFDPEGDPVPGGPQVGRPVPNTLRMVPYADSDVPNYNAAEQRRFFSANFGGLNGDGTGWTSECGDLAPVLLFETGNTGVVGFESACNRPILPDEVNGMDAAPEYFDGFVEHDDLPSSKYHMGGDMFLGEITSPFRTWYNGDGTGLGFPDSLDPAGETEAGDPIVRIPAIWGDDLGDHNPNTPSLQGDQIIPAAGPYATKIYGSLGRDGGNLLLLELLTRRTEPPFNNGAVWETWYGTHHPYAGPGTALDPNENLGFRDYNLDGLVDLGECRPAGSENYLADSDIGTGDTGTNTVYPFNRQRMVEDCVEILDESLDFDDFADDVALDAVTCEFGTFPTLLPVQYLTEPADGGQNLVFADGLCSGIVLLPNLSHQLNDFPIAPSFYPIHNEDGMDDPEFADATFPRSPNTPQIAWNIFFHDLVIAVDQPGESPGGGHGIGTDNFQTPYSAHEWLHSWEGFPDLYDYDVFAPPGPVINCPIGFWDIMAWGGLVHPSPILKEKPCTEWLKPIDLTTVLTPGVDTPVTFPPYELVRDNSVYFYENERRPGERYYFYSVGRGFDDPSPLPLETGYPGEGLLVQHTDVGSNPDALPLQQTNPPFSYLIVGADGLGELEAGTECGDTGDPFPGSTNNRQFNCNTNPPSRWYNENSCSGINILDVSNDGEGTSVVMFNWTPTIIPSIRIMDPPGGTSVNVGPGVRIYQVRSEATDVFGGTWIRLFHAPSGTDRSINSDGANYIGMVRKSSPGTNMEVVDWNINGLPDGPYRVFAELIPGPGADGDELAYTEPRAGRTNAGDGTMTINEVETNRPVASGLFGLFTSAAAPGTPNASRFRGVTPTGQEVNFTTLGVQVNDQLATNAPFLESGATLRKPIMRSITGISDGGRTLQLSTPAQLPAGDGPAAVTAWLITKPPRDARSESWIVQCVNTAGTEWRVFSSLTQPQPAEDAPNQDPYPHAFTGQQYTSVNGAVKFTINAGTTPYAIGDRFVFVTTGISAISGAVTIVAGVISETPVAIIEAAPLSGNPPLTVHFDGRSSFDPDGQPLTYRWDFGDGTATSASSVVDHVYANGGSYTAVLRVANPAGVFGEAQVDVNVTNNSPHAVAIATPLSGPIREVEFDGSQSSDLETDTDELLYEWDFGDGFVVGPGDPGEYMTTTHFYGANATYIAKLRVIDSGNKEDIDTIEILVGNTLPVPSITYTSLQGTSPHEVRFNGITSFDPDGDPITIEWIWGDGSPNETYPRTGVPGPPDDGIVPHTYRLPTGQTATTFNTTAIVRDNRGGTVAWPGVTITLSQAGVGASDPQAIFTITPEAPRVNQQFTADATLSFDRPAGSQIVSYFWAWGDGQTSTGRIATHTYTLPGTYTIELTVGDGETPPNTDTGEKTLIVLGGSQPPPEVENNPPTAVILVNPLEGIVGETSFAFDARSSTDPDGDDLAFTWNFGDGTSAVGDQVSHVFDQIGNFSVRLTVRDEANASANAIQSVSVLPVGSNLAPVARIATGLRTGSAPVTLAFDGRPSYDPNGDPLTYKWEFKRRGEVINTPTASQVTQYFEQPDTYTVELEVTDSKGASNRTAPEPILITARVTPPVDNDNTEGRPVDGGDPQDSANQRPGLGCGLGMVTSLFGMLLGLSLMAAAGRRQRP